MTFELLPVIDPMLKIYNIPAGRERFDAYLNLVEKNTKADLIVPVHGYNPMAKEQVVEKLYDLKKLNAENIVAETLQEINANIENSFEPQIFKVALNLSDDVKGGWTNRHTSDYDNKFKINALIQRKFCVPVLWVSESFTGALIRERTLEYVYRTIYWLSKPKPGTLQQHIEQEIFVGRHCKLPAIISISEKELLQNFYNEYKLQDDYHLIFNFLYGSEAAKSLNFPVYAQIPEMGGYNYAKTLIT